MQNINININGESIIKAIVYVVLFYVLFLIKDVILVTLVAIVLASAVEPAVKLFKKITVPRLPAVIVTYIFSLIILAGVFYFIVPSLLSDASNFLSKIPEYIGKITVWNPLKDVPVFPAQQVVESFSSLSSATGFSLYDLVANLQLILSNTTEGFLQTVDFVFGGALSFIIIIVLSFYLAVQENGVSNFLKVITPVRHQVYIINLWERSQHKIGLWTQGQVFLGLIIGILVFLSLAIMGIKGALLLAIIAGLFELIPVFGPILSAIPAIFVAFSEGVPAVGETGITAALIVAGIYLIIHQLENHLIYPLVVRKIIGVSPVVVILALIIGAKLAGFLGILLSVPVAAVIMEYFNDVQKRKNFAVENQLAKD